MRLNGQSAIVTGASLGLGRAIARTFVREGASVLLVARGADALKDAHDELNAMTAPGQDVALMVGDISDPSTGPAAVVRAARLPGRFSILVNNAGVIGPIGAFETVALDAWIEAIDANLHGAVRMCHAALPHFRAQGFGRIVNLSGGGASSPRPYFSAYASAKAALVRFTETLAQEVRDAGITANAISPGALNTRMLDEVIDAGAARTGDDVQRKAQAQRADGGASLDRAAALALLLASPEAGSITGRLISAPWDAWEQLLDRGADLSGSDIYTLRRITPEDRGRAW